MTGRSRLDVVMRLRELAEERARVDVARALTTHTAATDDLRAARALEHLERARMSAMQTAADTVAGDLRDASVAAAAAERRAAAAAGRADAAAHDLTEARTTLMAATRRREAVERLRDRILDAQRQDADRRDAVVASDIATTRHAFRLAVEGPQ